MSILRSYRRHTFRRLMATAALGTFLAIVVFLSLGSHMSADGQTCLLDQLQNSNCASMSISEMVTFHANALTRFISGALMPNLALLIAFFVIVFALAVAEVVPRHRASIARAPNHGPPPVVRQLTHWLSLLVSSPPSLIFGRV